MDQIMKVKFRFMRSSVWIEIANIYAMIFAR